MSIRPIDRSRTRRWVAMAALTAALVGSLAACGASSGSSGGGAAGVVVSAPPTLPDQAIALTPAYAKPDLVLTDQSGHSFDLRKQTDGHPTLLYFGYTHCPDVCPTTMADLAVAKSRLPEAEQQDLRVVFVSSDPTRDTPQRLKLWLDSFDPDFVGLTGDINTVIKAADSLGISIAPPVKNADGSYTVTHGAEVVVFSASDNKAHLIFPSGSSVSDYTDALSKIVKGGHL